MELVDITECYPSHLGGGGWDKGFLVPFRLVRVEDSFTELGEGIFVCGVERKLLVSGRGCVRTKLEYCRASVLELCFNFPAHLSWLFARDCYSSVFGYIQVLLIFKSSY